MGAFSSGTGTGTTLRSASLLLLFYVRVSSGGGRNNESGTSFFFLTSYVLNVFPIASRRAGECHSGFYHRIL